MTGILRGILGDDDCESNSDSQTTADQNADNNLGVDLQNSSYERDEDGNESSSDPSMGVDNATDLDFLVDDMTSNQSKSN